MLHALSRGDIIYHNSSKAIPQIHKELPHSIYLESLVKEFTQLVSNTLLHRRKDMRINPQSYGNILMTYKLLYCPWINTHAQKQRDDTMAQIMKPHMRETSLSKQLIKELEQISRVQIVGGLPFDCRW